MPDTTLDTRIINDSNRKYADPFYSESNMAHLQQGIAALNAGQGKRTRTD